MIQYCSLCVLLFTLSSCISLTGRLFFYACTIRVVYRQTVVLAIARVPSPAPCLRVNKYLYLRYCVTSYHLSLNKLHVPYIMSAAGHMTSRLIIR